MNKIKAVEWGVVEVVWEKYVHEKHERERKRMCHKHRKLDDVANVSIKKIYLIQHWLYIACGWNSKNKVWTHHNALYITLNK